MESSAIGHAEPGRDARALGRSFTSGLPLTIVSARYVSSFVARSRGVGKSNSSGVSSMKLRRAVARHERRDASPA